MNVSDPIADMLTRLRNAVLARHRQVVIPASRMKEAIAHILKDEGFIQDYEVVGEGAQRVIRIALKYTETREPVLNGLRRVSKPGRRIYTGRDEIPWVLSGMGIAILSTSRGVVTGRQARRLGVGGEVLCYIW